MDKGSTANGPALLLGNPACACGHTQAGICTYYDQLPCAAGCLFTQGRRGEPSLCLPPVANDDPTYILDSRCLCDAGDVGCERNGAAFCSRSCTIRDGPVAHSCLLDDA